MKSEELKSKQCIEEILDEYSKHPATSHIIGWIHAQVVIGKQPVEKVLAYILSNYLKKQCKDFDEVMVKAMNSPAPKLSI